MHTCGKKDYEVADMADKENMKELVSLAKNKDAHAFSLLYEMVYEDLYRMALYTLGNPHDAEDMVSDTVLDAYAQIGSLRDETAFRGWIFKILSNKCKRKIKEYVGQREHMVAELSEETFSMNGGYLGQQDEIEQLLDRQELVQAFLSISKEERLLVTMAVYGGYDSREIGRILHMNRNTVRSKYNRALKKMKKCLEDGENQADAISITYRKQ